MHVKIISNVKNKMQTNTTISNAVSCCLLVQMSRMSSENRAHNVSIAETNVKTLLSTIREQQATNLESSLDCISVFCSSCSLSSLSTPITLLLLPNLRSPIDPSPVCCDFNRAHSLQKPLKIQP